MLMTNGYITVNVREWVMAGGCWEYYITDQFPVDSDQQEAVVYGLEVELGEIFLSDVLDKNNMDELAKKALEVGASLYKRHTLGGIKPAPGWWWVTR